MRSTDPARLRLLLLPLLALLLTACGGGSSSTPLPQSSITGGGGGGSSSGGSGLVVPAPTSISSTASNVVSVVVDNGGPNITPAGSSVSKSLNVVFVTVTICVPGTSNCATVDHVQVDTGSSGLRLMDSVLPSGFASSLPQLSYGGSPLAECMQFADGNAWGALRQADLTIGSKTVGSLPLQIIGDPAIAEASGCQGANQENTPTAFGANGIIGINNLPEDCGSYCASNGGNVYFSCPGNTGCTNIPLPVANQVPNPVTRFASDNNGTMLILPAIPSSGADTVYGYLVFGINTQSNNALGNATVIPTDAFGFVTTTYAGQVYSTSYFDSGTNELGIPNTGSVAVCGVAPNNYYCPPGAITQSATVTPAGSLSGTSVILDFTLENPAALNSANPALSALDNVGIPTPVSTSTGSFVWGEPFFYGRSVFTAIGGQSVSGANPPFVAI